MNNTAAPIEDPPRSTDEELARGDDGVDVSWYLTTYPDVAAAGMDPVTHYLQSGWRERRDPRPDFSTAGYLTLNDEVARSGQNPLVHFLRNGGRNGESAASPWHLFWSKGFLYPKLGAEPPSATRPFGAQGRQKILFVGHEATRTGAPLILLALMEAIERDTGAELFLVLERDGPLLESYRRVAHVLVNRQGWLYGLLTRELFDQITGPAPQLAICNCAETWRLLSRLRQEGLPYIIVLIHERLSRYPVEAANVLSRDADRVIFPAHAVKRAAMEVYPQFGGSDVVPQGLLKDEFGLADKTAARRGPPDRPQQFRLVVEAPGSAGKSLQRFLLAAVGHRLSLWSAPMTPSLPTDTERLQFRRLEMGDVDELVALHEDPLVARFLGSRDRASVEHLIRMVDEEWAERGHGRIAVVERESDDFIGRTGLKHWQQFGETEVSWVLRSDARGKGYATEAGAAALRWGFERFDPPYLTAMIQPDNTASLRVAERLRMKPIRTDRLLGEEVIVHAIKRVDFVAL